MTTRVQGEVAPGFEGVRDAFAAAFEGSPQMGAALAVRRRGATVVDLWGGLADARDGTPWTADTATVIFSCTKGVMSVLAAALVQQGRLDYDEPVATYWPEFAQAGKGGVLVRDILAHRAGLSAPREDFTTADLADWDRITTALAAQRPLWEPGTGYAYHAITHGWLIGEIIRRVTGLRVSEYLAVTLTDPLGADAWIGLPATQAHRVAHLRVGESLADLVAQQNADPMPGIDWNARALTLGGALPRELAGEGVGFNDPAIRAAAIPAAGGIATARALAAIWSSTVTETDGFRVLDDSTLDRALPVQSEGEPVFPAPPPWPRWAMGFQLDAEARRYLGDASFGHDGAGGQVAFADRAAKVGFTFLTNQMEAIDDFRATRIIDALRAGLAQTP
jgi:CubicO group peptidase (beta-lactamase class C family)